MPAAKKSTDSNDVLMGVLAYFGILFLIPLLAAKNSKFAQFHAKQGLNLFVAEVAVWVLGWILTFVFWPLYIIVSILSLVLLILAIIGIVNAASGKQEPLPILGELKIIK